jgi:hypothetical protein
MMKTSPAKVLQSSVSLSEALTPSVDKFIVFRCHLNDDCYGWGDRYAGLACAAAVAMSTGRALKIDWPGLSGFLSPGSVNWTYDPAALGISPADQRTLQHGNLSQFGTRAFPDLAFQNLSQDVAVYNALYWYNLYSMFQVDSWEALSPYRVVVMTGNRGVNRQWFEQLRDKYGWPYRDQHEFFSDLFDVMFAPTQAFLSMKVPLADNAVMSLGDMAATLSRADSYSMVLHFRAGDHTTCKGNGTVLSASSCVETEFRSRGGGDASRAVVVILSDSTCSVRRTYDHLRHNLSNITTWLPINSGRESVQIDTRISNTPSKALEALERTLRDLWLMRSARYLVQQGGGFPGAASIISTTLQSVFDYDCQQVPVGCYRRFC